MYNSKNQKGSRMNKSTSSDYRQLTYSNEKNILSHYRDSDDSILAFPQSKEIEAVYHTTHDAEQWKLWVDSNGKADKTPDFYCDKYQMMMEVMRFDDKAYKNGKVNPTLARETELLKELAEIGLLEAHPHIEYIQVNAVTQLPTDEDHNFSRFRSNFVRVIGSHSKKVETYKKNHPGYKLVFFVFDETSGVYHRRVNASLSEHHFYWADSVLVKAIKESKADFVIWYKPYNAYETLDAGFQDGLPKIVIYDVANMQIEPENYIDSQMFSGEE
jgi:hypothetical protein